MYPASQGTKIAIDSKSFKDEGKVEVGCPPQGTQGLAGRVDGGFIVQSDLDADTGVVHVLVRRRNSVYRVHWGGEGTHNTAAGERLFLHYILMNSFSSSIGERRLIYVVTSAVLGG